MARPWSEGMRTLTLVAVDLPGTAREQDFIPSLDREAIPSCNRSAFELVDKWHGEVLNALSFEEPLVASFQSATEAVEMASELIRLLFDQSWHPVRGFFRAAIVTADLALGHENESVHAASTLSSLRDVARAGQILVAQSTHCIARQRLSIGHGFYNLGVHHLEDGQRAQQIFQLTHPDLPHVFQSLPSLVKTYSNLPMRDTRFIGRLEEIEEVKEKFYDTRVVNICGLSGVGKSRLGIVVAAEMLEDHFHGGSYVDLSETASDQAIFESLAEALGLVGPEPAECERAVIDKLHDAEKLVVFDNVDKGPRGASRVIDRILDRCPRIQILSSSRQPLAIPTAEVYILGPMKCPEPHRRYALEELAQFDAIALFAHRAAAAKTGFELTNQNVQTVSEICRALEGMPLAIELAAGKLVSLELADIHKGLGSSVSALTRVTGASQPEQEAIVAWSYEGLSDFARLTLVRLSVFSGVFDRESAVSVCGYDPLTVEDVHAVLAELSARSLLFPVAGEAELYDVPKPVRRFARGVLIKLAEIGEVKNRHAEWFAARAMSILARAAKANGETLLEEVSWFSDNYEAALSWALAEPSDSRVAHLALVLAIHWKERAEYRAGLTTLKRVLAECRCLRGALRAQVECAAGEMAYGLHRFAEAQKFYESAALAAKLDHHNRLLCEAGLRLGAVLLEQGDSASGAEKIEEALSIARTLKDHQLTADCLYVLGRLMTAQRRFEYAEQLVNEASDINDRFERPEALADCSLALATLSYRQNDWDRSSERIGSAVKEYIQLHRYGKLVECLRILAAIHLQTGAHHSSAVLLGLEGALRSTYSIDISDNAKNELSNNILRLKTVLGSHFHPEFHRGESMPVDQLREFLMLSF